MASASKVRVRFAPSPTGYLHVGGARTALYNFLFAKHNGGDFILRVEDTDLERSTEESMRMQIQDLEWLGIPWDEGPNPKDFTDMGPVGPYRQSRRKDIYMEHAQRLIAQGRAYYDFRTDAELDALKAAAVSAGQQFQVETPKSIVPPEEAKKRIAAGELAAIRYKVAEKRDYVLHDLVRGDVTFPSDMVGDFVCIRSNGMPVYNFCCVVDDALMKMTHIFRAEEHLPNTLRQMMLYEAFGYEMPKFGHLSFILGADRQKLSKRHGASSCNDYRVKGYLPEALNNFILLSGWSSPKGDEIMSREEQIAQFTADRFNSSPAIFDAVKLEWMNSQYLRALPHEELWRRTEPFLKEAGIELSQSKDAAWRDQALSIFKIKMNTLLDAVALFLPLDDSKFAIKPDAAEALGWPETRKVLEAWKSQLQSIPEDRLTEQQFDQAQEAVKVAAGVKGKNLFMPIRVAVVGQPHGSELKMVVPLLAKSSLLHRVDQALAALKV
ncbi:MAG: glutamate--tRNA ligase [Proteobacteria bacterium]|nr:MAG: glutamate--tRNA ligase [Pseudomonadota bacterium]